MARHAGIVLVDTNVILECWRAGCWRALAGGYRLETVEDCMTETQTGFQRRSQAQQVDAGELRSSLAAVHPVGPTEVAVATLRDASFGNVDVGERSLWAHALSRNDAWLLCGPDKASLRLGVRLGLRDRLVALEGLLADVGHRPRETLRLNYTTRWHRATLAELALSEGVRPG